MILDQLYTQVHLPAHPNRLLQFIIRQGRLHPLLQKRIYLLRRATNKACWIEKTFKLALDWIEVTVLTNAVDEVVLQAELLYLMCSFMGENLSNMDSNCVNGEKLMRMRAKYRP